MPMMLGSKFSPCLCLGLASGIGARAGSTEHPYTQEKGGHFWGVSRAGRLLHSAKICPVAVVQRYNPGLAPSPVSAALGTTERAHVRFPASLLEIARANSVHAWPETKSFKALGEEFETPPKFAENT